MSDYTQPIAAMEAELAALDARRPKLIAAITAFRDLTGDTAPPAPIQFTDLRPAPVAEQPKPQTPDQRRHIPRAERAHGVTDEKMLEVIARLQPVSPRDAATELRMDKYAFKQRSEKLRLKGLLVATGVTHSRRLSLPPAPATERAPQEEVGIVPAAATFDAAIMVRLKQGRATRTELIDAVPDHASITPSEKVIAVNRALRRLSLRNVVMDLGDKFQLA